MVPEVGMAVLGVSVSVLVMDFFCVVSGGFVWRFQRFRCGLGAACPIIFAVGDITWVNCLWAPSSPLLMLCVR